MVIFPTGTIAPKGRAKRAVAYLVKTCNCKIKIVNINTKGFKIIVKSRELEVLNPHEDNQLLMDEIMEIIRYI